MSFMPADSIEEEDKGLDVEDDNQPGASEDGSVEEGDDHGAETAKAPDLDPHVIEEIERVLVEEESSTKKPHMLPRRLIDEELRADDLFDIGSI